jgi:hypothetical protein
MKRALILVLATASCAVAQERGNVIYRTTGTVSHMASGGYEGASGHVLGGPYWVTVQEE